MSLPVGSRSLAAAGALLGVSAVQFYRYEKGQRQIAPERVPMVEMITGIPRKVLRPDVYDDWKGPKKSRGGTSSDVALT